MGISGVKEKKFRHINAEMRQVLYLCGENLIAYSLIEMSDCNRNSELVRPVFTAGFTNLVCGSYLA